MVQNVLLLSNQTEFIDSLVTQTTQMYPKIDGLLNRITSVMVEESPEIVRRYFALYTVPVLEMSDLFKKDTDELMLWAFMQTQLGVNIRYMDNVVDGDPGTNNAALLLASHRVLADAKRLLAEDELSWGEDQDDVYGQYLAYETENQNGFHHDFDSLWRRVSPLCVVTDTYLCKVIPKKLIGTYKRYLAWSLLQADCDDSLKDLAANVNTPVTRTLRQSIFGVYLDWTAGVEVIADLKRFLKRQCELIQGDLEMYPAWSNLIRSLDQTFAHEEQVTDSCGI